jgi:protein phosphatase 1 regulatory subunit 37
MERARVVLGELASLIEVATDAGRLAELLGVNDELTGVLAGVSASTVGKPATPTAAAPAPAPNVKPKLRLEGLGLRWDAPSSSRKENGNGAAVVSESPVEDQVLTPRMDKGKARAEPEPVVQEKILSPNFLIEEEEEEEEEEEGRSPVEGEEEEEGEVLPPSDR